MKARMRSAEEAATHCLDLWAAATGNKGARDLHGRMLVAAYGRTTGTAPSVDEEKLCQLLVEDTPGFTALKPFLERVWVSGLRPTLHWQSEYRVRVLSVFEARASARFAGFCGSLGPDLKTFSARVGEAYMEQQALAMVEDVE